MPSGRRGDRLSAGEGSWGASPGSDPISPELVLVAPPDEAQRVREQLPEIPSASWERRISNGRAGPPAFPPDAAPVRPRRRRRWVRRTFVAAVLVILVASAVAVGLAGSRGTNDDSKGHLTLAPARHQSAMTTAGPTTTAPAKTRSKSTPRRQSRPAETRKPKTHAAPRPSANKKKKPSTTSAKKRARTRAHRPQRPAVTGFVPARTWSWEPQSRARRYVFTLQRNGRRVVAARTAKPRYVLPKRFRFAAGRYRWRVVALTTKRGARRKLVVDSKFRLSAAGAAAANG